MDLNKSYYENITLKQRFLGFTTKVLTDGKHWKESQQLFNEIVENDVMISKLLLEENYIPVVYSAKKIVNIQEWLESINSNQTVVYTTVDSAYIPTVWFHNKDEAVLFKTTFC